MVFAWNNDIKQCHQKAIIKFYYMPKVPSYQDTPKIPQQKRTDKWIDDIASHNLYLGHCAEEKKQQHTPNDVTWAKKTWKTKRKPNTPTNKLCYSRRRVKRLNYLLINILHLIEMNGLTKKNWGEPLDCLVDCSVRTNRKRMDLNHQANCKWIC